MTKKHLPIASFFGENTRKCRFFAPPKLHHPCGVKHPSNKPAPWLYFRARLWLWHNLDNDPTTPGEIMEIIERFSPILDGISMPF